MFRTDEAAFQAGYLAAQMTTTGTVATFGGIPIATVIPFMNGFAAGVLYYNRHHKRKVTLLGWNPRTQKGEFVSQDPTDYNAFNDREAASRITADLISAGADIIMPVDGPTGEDGAGQAAAGLPTGKVLLIGVDTDQFFSAPTYSTLWLTSVLKSYRRMVKIAMGEVVDDRFKGGVLYGTLENGGVGLAPFHGFETSVPFSLPAKLEEIKRGIAEGTISVDPTSYLGTAK